MTNCPTCDQKMVQLTISREGLQTSVCRQCGTLTVDQLTYYSDISGTFRVSTWVPQLVLDCRDYLRAINEEPEDAKRHRSSHWPDSVDRLIHTIERTVIYPGDRGK